MTPRSLRPSFRPHWALLLLLLLLLLPASTVRCRPETSISTTAGTKLAPERISWDTNITLLGDACLKKGAISLTRDSAASAGRALYSQPIRFLEPTTRSPASFSSRFAFSITPSSPGDGLAFLLTSDPHFLGSPNGFLGLFSDLASASKADDAVTIAVEFDTNLDAPLRDINDNHVALDVDSIFSFAASDAGNAGVDLKARIPMMAWVEYSSTEKAVRVWLSYSHFRPPDPLLVARVDLSGLFREFMYVGFSASNGHGTALHIVTRWSFRTFGFAAASSASPAGNGTDVAGCANCSTEGQKGGDTGDEYLNPGDGPVASLAVGTRRYIRVVLVVGGVVVFVCLLLLLIAAVISCLRGNEEEGSEGSAPETAVGGEFQTAPARISLDEIRSATKEFHCSKILGQGGSATVYEGVLPSGCKVAVKRFGQVDRFSRTLATELAAVMGSCRHPNLVPLRGWCCEKDELVLVHEYMPNGSLDKILHAAAPFGSPVAGQPPALSWDQRWKIVLGVASALVFLHEECEKKIIHRDVKACNVLLDAEFNAKVGDFGLAELNDHNRTPPVAKPAGTMGYLAPEYVHSGVATEKSDVYSFGILALEVATGRKPVEKAIVLVDWVWSLWGRRRVVDAADPRLEGSFNRDEMGRMLVVGLCCAHPDSKRRPTMRKAIRMLRGAATLTALPARKPAVRLLSQLPPTSQDSCSQASGDATTSWFSPCISLNQLEEQNYGRNFTAATRTPFS
ncbi:L-type lectin-domain containing receptor kinase S.7 [Phoenix dactylifera]|uniref:non-specific serine/threonine protein kinase n=1 Tax=Phoenix dactylifera TaxID=42345 RepID=A0A8B7CRQ8_PHODC|nr:L-type lectin-domain containing receptor kinase S.7 [Phoenix dactylifera]